MLADAGVLDAVEIAVPGDDGRAAQLLAVREAVPAAVNRRVGRAKQAIDPRIEKTAADMIVPFDRLDELLALYDREFARARAGRGRVGPHLGRQRASQRHPAHRSRMSNPARRRSSSSAVRCFGWAERRWRSTASAGVRSSRSCCG